MSDSSTNTEGQSSILEKSHLPALFTGAVLILLVVAFSLAADVFITSTGKPGQQDIDLSGTWLIRFDDQPVYAKPWHNDSTWCFINVPDSTKKATSLPGRTPSRDCPDETYPVTHMQHTAYWYRTTVTIPEGKTWEKPALFLGSIQNEGWAYWDGEFIGSGRSELSPTIFILPKEKLAPGEHLLAVRVTSGESRTPGIYHRHLRKVALGEFSQSLNAFYWQRQQRYFETVVVLVLQFSALLLIFWLGVRSRKPSADLFWLSLFFGGVALQSCSTLALGGDLKWLLFRATRVVMHLGLFCYAMRLLTERRTSLERIASWITFIALVIIATGFLRHENVFLGSNWIGTVYPILSILVLIPIGFREGKRLVESPRVVHNIVLLSLIVVFQFFDFANGLSYLWLKLGQLIDTKVFQLALILTLLGFAVDDHVNKENELSFYGRYVRRGLKEMLSRNRKKMIAGEKIFFGRKVVILKIDIIDHTATTFGMPYGLKRLYQDCWFVNIDNVVATRTFMDKGLGDGSLYYFENASKEVPGAIFDAAVHIRDHVLAKFDADLKNRFDQWEARHTEAKESTDRFLKDYRKRLGHDFWDRKTRARFVLTAGMADEGLWGLVAQGHYDLEGDLVTLTARLERAAEPQEIIMNEAFAKAIEESHAQSKIDVIWREVELRGIGKQRVAAVRGTIG